MNRRSIRICLAFLVLKDKSAAVIAALGRYNLKGIIAVKYRSVFTKRYGRGIMEWAVCFQSLRVKMPACAAVQASAIRIVSNRERAAYLFMPATKKLCEQADFPAKCLVRLINEGFPYFVLFKNRLHFIFSSHRIAKRIASEIYRRIAGRVLHFIWWRFAKIVCPGFRLNFRL